MRHLLTNEKTINLTWLEEFTEELPAKDIYNALWVVYDDNGDFDTDTIEWLRDNLRHYLDQFIEELCYKNEIHGTVSCENIIMLLANNKFVEGFKEWLDE